VRGERGAALVEVIVAIIILAGVLLSLAAASGHAARQMYFSRREMNVWGALQSQAESLRAVGYQNVTNGSSTVEGYSVAWTVKGTDPKTVTVVLSYKTREGAAATKTVELYYPASDTL
jgi:Tfp pilus assembly protein PilV